MKKITNSVTNSLFYFFLLSLYLVLLSWFDVGVSITNFTPEGVSIPAHNILLFNSFIIGFVLFSCAFNLTAMLTIKLIKKIFNK